MRSRGDQAMKIRVVIISMVLCFCCLYSYSAGAEKDKEPSATHKKVKADDSYFPMGKGYYWKYRCGTEGEFHFEKTMRIISASISKKITLYKVEFKTSIGEKPFVYYLFKDKGMIFRTFDLNITEREAVITVDPKLGDRIDKEFTIYRNRTVQTSVTGRVNTIVVENFNIEQSSAPTKDPMTWSGVFYAKGIGRVVEADGLGGECVLADYYIDKQD